MKTRNAILLVILAEVLIAALAIFNYSSSLEGLQATTRYSGRLSLFLFSFIFLLHPKEKTILAFYFSGSYFLIFSIAHGIHLVELLSYVSQSGIPLVPYRVAGGFVAYAMIFLMPWFQVKFNQQKISAERFQGLGYVYLFYVWFIFFMTYISRLTGGLQNAGGSHSEYVTLMGWVCVMLAIKILQIFRRSQNM